MNYHALRYLLKKKEARNLPHSKGKQLKYTELLMAESLCSSDLDISTDRIHRLLKAYKQIQ